MSDLTQMHAPCACVHEEALHQLPSHVMVLEEEVETLQESIADYEDRLAEIAHTRAPRAALLSRLAEIRSLYPAASPHAVAPVRMALMCLLRYVDDNEVTDAALTICPALILERS